MSVRTALGNRLQQLQDRRARLQAELLVLTSQIQDIQALRDALSPQDEARLIELVRSGVLKVED